MTARIWKLALAGLLVVSTTAVAQTRIELKPDRDNTLIERPDGIFSNALGRAVFVGKANASNPHPIKRIVMRFDIEGTIPPGATIQSVSLGLRVMKINFTETKERSIFLHRLLDDWGEGTSLAIGRDGGGAVSTEGDATWLHRFYPDVFWENPGGDFVPTSSATTILGDSRLEFYVFESTAAMVADVQSWVDDPASNFGWLMLGEGEENTDRHTARRIASRHALNEAERPTLTIEFTAPTSQTCRAGTVDLAGAGTPQNVLTINGSAGNGARVVPVPVDGAISVDIVASGSGPSPGPFVLYVWPGEPTDSTVTPLPKNLGDICFPMPVTGGDPQPLKVWNNIGRQSKLGTPDFPSSAAPSNIITVPSGSNSPVIATLQGILLDDGSAADAPASITNAVVLQVE